MIAVGLLGWLGFWRQVPAHQALIVAQRSGKREVYFDRARVLPLVETSEVVDLSIKLVAVACIGKSGLATRDDYRLDVRVVVYLKIPRDKGAVLKAADYLGVEQTHRVEAITAIMTPAFADLLQRAVSNLDAGEILEDSRRLTDALWRLVDDEYFGFKVVEFAVDLVRERLHVD